MDAEITVPREWEELAETIPRQLGEPPCVLMVLGASDTGKTTLAKFLLRRWGEIGLSVAFIDADVGQSTLGPPGTIGAGLYPTLASLEHFPPGPEKLALYFVGSFSPVGHLLQTLAGVKRMVERACAWLPSIVLIDTTGLILGAIGAHLKYQKVSLVEPRHLVLLQRSNELEHLKRLFTYSTRCVVHPLPVVEAVKPRSLEQRRAYREQKLREYFRPSRNVTLDFPEVILWGHAHFAGVPLREEEVVFISRILEGEVLYGEVGGRCLFLVVKDFIVRRHLDTLEAKYGTEHFAFARPSEFLWRLVSLEDRGGEVIAVGVVTAVEFRKRQMEVLMPAVDVTEVHLVKMGSERVDFRM